MSAPPPLQPAAPDRTDAPAGPAMASAVPAESHSRWGVLRHRHYRNMLGAQFVSNIGGWMEMFGMQWLVAKKTGSLEALGYLGAAQLTPIFLFGIFGGLVADRVNRRTLLVTTQTLLMLVAAAVAILAATDFAAPAWLDAWYTGIGTRLGLPAAAVVIPLLLLSAINGTVLAFNFPAWQVLTPRLVPREELIRAITVNGVQFNLSRVIGPALAGFISGAWGTTPLFVVNALSFLAVVVTATTTPDAPAPARDGSRPTQQILAAVRFTFGSRGPLAIFLAMTLMSLLAAPLVRILPLFVIDVYGLTDGGDAEAALMLAVQGLGAVLGGLALRRIPSWYPKHHFIPTAVFAAGLSITLFAATTELWLGYLAMFICGFFWIWAFNQSWAAMQHLVSDSMRGRVLAIANVSAFGATAIGNVGIGWIGEGLKDTWHWHAAPATQVSVALLSVPLMVAGFVMLLKRTPEIDGLPRGSAPGVRQGILEAFLARSHRPRTGAP